MVIRIITFILLVMAGMPSDACTSMIVSASRSASGRPLIWKHRDTSADNNFLYRVEEPGRIGYVGLFNGGDTLMLDEAWMGMNDDGFAIINTVAYNLPANNPAWADREGFVMAEALGCCRTVGDFEDLLLRLPKPMGLRTCFGVLDAEGCGAYFEVGDSTIVRFNLDEARNGILVRTNYAYSGAADEGQGYIRHRNVLDILEPQIATSSITPASLTECVSRSFYNSLTGIDALESSARWAIDQDYVPRHSSTASIVIEGVRPGESTERMRMWAVVGYPPCSHAVGVSLHDIPAEVSATEEHPRSALCDEAAELKKIVFPVGRGSGKHYIDLNALREITALQHALSLEAYSKE